MANIDLSAQKNAQQWLDSNSISSSTTDLIKDMMLNNIEQFNESFYRNLEFGTGGLRGIMGIGTNRMNQYTVAMATQGFANYIIESNPNKEIKAVISFDNRRSEEHTSELQSPDHL